MIDTVQFVLFIVILILTVLLVILGIQVYFILKEIRHTIQKTNKVLDDTGLITESISKPVSSLSSLSMSIKAGSMLTVAKIIKSFLSKNEESSDKTRDKKE